MKRRRRRTRVSNGQDKQSTDNQVSNLSELPFSVLSEIFFKLPIKSIICCKCVCTEWRNLISDPDFSQGYARNSRITRLLLFPCALSTRNIYFLEFENGNYNWPPLQLKLLPGLSKRESAISVVGVCNGFVCLSFYWNNFKHEVICVTNPITGDSILLPQLKSSDKRVSSRRGKRASSTRERSAYTRSVKYCFGFDPCGNRYKVLGIIYKYSPLLGYSVEECVIFTVGVDDGWRILSVSFMDLGYWSNVTFFNGAFYWIPYQPASLSTFDLAEEKLGQVSFPPDLVLDRGITLGASNNQLYLLYFSSPAQIIMWTTKMDSIAESWTKIVILTGWLPAHSCSWDLLPVAESRNGEIHFTDQFQCLMSLNLHQKKCSEIDICAGGDFTIREIYAYDPSFHDSPSNQSTNTWKINCRSF